MVNNVLKLALFPRVRGALAVSIGLRTFLVYGSSMPGKDRALIIGETSENLLKLCELF